MASTIFSTKDPYEFLECVNPGDTDAEASSIYIKYRCSLCGVIFNKPQLPEHADLCAGIDEAAPWEQ